MLSLIHSVHAVNFIRSSSLLTCMDNSQFTASHFDVKYYPNNHTVYFDVMAFSQIDGNVTATVNLIAYGINAFTKKVSFCSLGFGSICPLQTGRMELNSNYELGPSIYKQIPSVAFTIPDLDARVQITLVNDDTGDTVACVQAALTNGKTVQTKYAAWPIAAISGLGVITSGVVSVIGHSNTAAHIASNSMSLFIYFQSLAITSMMAVAKVPPIAAAWAQNFVWSLGIVRVAFVQDIANWYIQATGGTPTDVIHATYLSVSVQKKVKRALDYVSELAPVSNSLSLGKRASISLDSDNFGYADQMNSTLYTVDEKDSHLGTKILVLRGIQRVSYLAGIEITSLFMTTIIFLLFFAFVMVVCLTMFKAIIEILIRSKIMNEGKFNEYRQQWSQIVKGALYRLLMIAFPQLAVMCLWQLTERDSVATVIIAVFLLIISIILLFQAAIRVFLMGRKSIRQFKNPAYLLFGDGTFLNKFGFVYVQFRADCYYFILISLIYIFAKSLFVAVLQHHGKVQSIIVFVIELFYLVAVCFFRPFMDRRTNAFNITIAVINTINALFYMFFSYVFRQPHIVASVMAVVYFILNAVFALFLLIFTIVTCVLALLYKNPDTRYQPMKDDRVSFLPRFDNPNQPGKKNVNGDDMELMALGATAMKGHEHGAKPGIYDEDESVYDDASMFNRKNNSKSSENSDADVKRDSYYLESIEPTQPSSTIVGDPSNAMSGYSGSSYGSYGNSNYSHHTASSRNPNQQQNHAGYPQKDAFHGNYI
ncbi:TRP-domain-containing protein [Suhomyces tanzawaensis NRRL Y-17324]|uniref:TRP-domain-containing protein n=1 Tax=Suhomyces tanzawaensis NRRL Y-17324 TaxID=984487 RepID=A0A1E4SP59_9ASCO|nr:TRP-domain-containing protein [Suhomyces tanzawaensis NRRL Y-17324]ODV81197.1 TRP-domain-containing protein [Suhomyces tanzawaensis NRRL Y-17324]